MTEDVKSRMAAKLLALPRNNTMKFGLPDFPKLEMTTELYDLVTEDSWQFFDIVKVAPDFLALPPSEWADNEDYMTAREYVTTLKVTYFNI